MPHFTRSIRRSPDLPARAALRHNNRRLRAGKTVKNRRRRATVRRKKFRACHCPLFFGREGRAEKVRRARRPTESAAAKPETIPDARSTYLPRETGEEAFPMRFSVRVLFFLWFASFLLINFSSPGLSAQSQSAKISGTITDPHGAAIAHARVSAESSSVATPTAQAVSANDGQFSLTLAPGHYRLKIAHESFATLEQDFDVAAGEKRRWKFISHSSRFLLK